MGGTFFNDLSRASSGDSADIIGWDCLETISRDYLELCPGDCLELCLGVLSRRCRDNPWRVSSNVSEAISRTCQRLY